MQVINVDHIETTANGQGFLVDVIAVLVSQLIQQTQILKSSCHHLHLGSDTAQLNDLLWEDHRIGRRSLGSVPVRLHPFDLACGKQEIR